MLVLRQKLYGRGPQAALDKLQKQLTNAIAKGAPKSKIDGILKRIENLKKSSGLTEEVINKTEEVAKKIGNEKYVANHPESSIGGGGVTSGSNNLLWGLGGGTAALGGGALYLKNRNK